MAQPQNSGLGVRVILLVLICLLLAGVLPAWPYSAGWGYYPSGAVGVVLLVVLLLVVLDKI